MRNRKGVVGTRSDDNWPIGMLPDGGLNIASRGDAQSVLRSREAARPTSLTEGDCDVLLRAVIDEMARLQVEAWFKKALRSVLRPRRAQLRVRPKPTYRWRERRAHVNFKPD